MICLSCPVRKECGDWKKASGSTDGIWAAEYNSEKKERKKASE